MNLTNLRNAVQLADELREAIADLPRQSTDILNSALEDARAAHWKLQAGLECEVERRRQSAKQEVAA